MLNTEKSRVAFTQAYEMLILAKDKKKVPVTLFLRTDGVDPDEINNAINEINQLLNEWHSAHMIVVMSEGFFEKAKAKAEKNN